MKGFTKVEVSKANKAIDDFLYILKKGKQFVNVGALRFHDRYYVAGGWYTKWRYKGYSEKAFLLAKRGGLFVDYAEMLQFVLDEDELEAVNFYCNNSPYAIEGLKSLCELSLDGTILVDQDMAKFINQFGEKE